MLPAYFIPGLGSDGPRTRSVVSLTRINRGNRILLFAGSLCLGHSAMRLCSIGHSTRSIEEFVELLKKHEIRILVDVRRWPSSRRLPFLGRERLAGELRGHGIRYELLGDQLGGFRKEGLGESSPNKAWSGQGFRDHADYTMTEQFREGAGRLLALAQEGKLAFMSTERLYRRCHRRIISDYLKVKGHTVTHIAGKEKRVEHELTKSAKIIDGEFRYPEVEAGIFHHERGK